MTVSQGLNFEDPINGPHFTYIMKLVNLIRSRWGRLTLVIHLALRCDLVPKASRGLSMVMAPESQNTVAVLFACSSHLHYMPA